MTNKTTSFMYAFCSTFGTEFINLFIGELYYTLYLGDWNYKNYNNFTDYKKFIEDDIIFALMSPKKGDFSFEKRLLLVQSHENYIADYEIGEKRMVVFKVDEPHKTSLRMLKRSQFSKMYSPSDVDKWFKASKSFYISYVDRNGEVRINKDNCESIPDLEKNYHKIVYSPYHILRKTPALRELLECIFHVEIDYNQELAEKINIESEILNFKEVKLLQA